MLCIKITILNEQGMPFIIIWNKVPLTGKIISIEVILSGNKCYRAVVPLSVW